MLPTRRFGRTEIQMPVFSCGGMRFQQGWEKGMTLKDIKPENQRNLEATVHRSLELGINHIETARGYGPSELQLGEVLPGIPREKYILQTKLGPKEDPAEFTESFETSMKLLKADYLDLLGIHGINNEATFEQSMRCLETARQWQKEGRVRHIGFSTHGWCGIIEKAINTGEFDYVNLHWFFAQQRNWAAVQAATRQDMGVFIISPNDKGGMLHQPSDKLKQLCGDVDPMVFNDLWCLSRPEVHTLSLGAAQPSDFDVHVEGMQDYGRAEEISAPIAAKLVSEINKVCGNDWYETFEEGLPEFFELPGDIYVKEILRLWTLAKGLDMIEYGQMRYNLIGNADHWFPGQNGGEFDETVLLDALQGYRYADRIPDILRETHAMLYTAPKKRLSES